MFSYVLLDSLMFSLELLHGGAVKAQTPGDVGAQGKRYEHCGEGLSAVGLGAAKLCLRHLGTSSVLFDSSHCLKVKQSRRSEWVGHLVEAKRLL